jgi:hypothetical protein
MDRRFHLLFIEIMSSIISGIAFGTWQHSGDAGFFLGTTLFLLLFVLSLNNDNKF